MNIKQFAQEMRNPKQFVLNKILPNYSDSMISHLVQLAQNGKYQEVETIVRNYCGEHDINYDEVFPQFMSNFKIR